MKKVVLALGLMISLICAESELAFKKGSNAFGLGFTASWIHGIGGSVLWDMGAINDMFSLGADISFSTDSEEATVHGYGYIDDVTVSSRWTYFRPAFRFGFHPFGIPALSGKVAVANVLDPYALIRAGVGIASTSIEYDPLIDGLYNIDDTKGSFAFDVAVGVRWKLKENFALWGEVGSYKTTLGVAFML